MEQAIGKKAERLSARRTDLYLPDGPAGFPIIEITARSDIAHGHIYMENHVFTPDSRRFIFQRHHGYALKKGSRKRDLFICDMDDDYSIRQLTDENVAGLSNVTPDGKYAYYFVCLTDRLGFSLKRVALETGLRETVMVVDKPLPGYTAVPVQPIQSAVRLDGLAVTTQCYIGLPWAESGPYALIVLDLTKGEPRIILEGEDYFNQHVQYSRDPENPTGILVQHNHGCCVDVDPAETNWPDYDSGKHLHRSDGGYGTDIHVIRDDGTHFRDLPWGRDGHEFCQGHQCWRGTTGTAVSANCGPNGNHIVEARPMACEYNMHHRGRRLPGAEENRNILSRFIENPRFVHFGFDSTGEFFVSDWVDGDWPDIDPLRDKLVLSRVGTERGAVIQPKDLCRTGTVFADYETHPHPALSPDHKTVIFNAGAPGKLPQAMAAHVSDDMFK